MIDHMTLTVRDVARARAFYERALAPLGYRVLTDYGGACGLGDAKPDLWLRQGVPPTPPTHFAFTARTREDVDAFYEAALEAGGRDNGPPGLRAHYHPTYYGAFVFDPDGHPIEAVCHARATARRGPSKAAPPTARPAKAPAAGGRVAKTARPAAKAKRARAR